MTHMETTWSDRILAISIWGLVAAAAAFCALPIWI